MPRNVARAWFDLVLEVAHTQSGESWLYREYRVSSASINFGINRIPSATCTLAIGRDAKGLAPAPIHETAEDFKQSRPCRLRLLPKGQWLPSEQADGQWTQVGPRVIFDGYITGLGYRRQQGSTVPVLNMSHWLSDLSFASMLSDQSHPSNPAGFRWYATGGVGASSSTSKTGFLTDSVDTSRFTPNNIQTDFWAKSLHLMFADFSDKDVVWKIGAIEGCEGIKSTNSNAQRALCRIETHLSDHDEIATGEDCHCKGAGSPYWKPLAFDTVSGANIEFLIAAGIGDFLRESALEAYFNSTIWDKLVGELAPAFYFSLIPRVETAIVAPFVPGLRTTFEQEYENGKVLDFQDISSWETSSAAIRPLRAVGVLPGKMQEDTNYSYGLPQPISDRLGGCFAPDAKEPGMIMYVGPPKWLQDIPLHAHDPQQTIFAAVASSTTPMQLATLTAAESLRTNPAVVASRLTNFYDNVAHYIYAQEMLRGRYAMVSGKLRFDLGPGTTVAIRNAKPLFLADDALSKDSVASISRVSITLNAESGQAGTAFQLDYLRTAEENESDRTSIDRHPLYETVFTGAPLLHDYLFPEQSSPTV